MNLINSILLQSDSNIVGRIERINDINLSGENVKGTERISRLFNKKYCHYELLYQCCFSYEAFHNQKGHQL